MPMARPQARIETGCCCGVSQRQKQKEGYIIRKCWCVAKKWSWKIETKMAKLTKKFPNFEARPACDLCVCYTKPARQASNYWKFQILILSWRTSIRSVSVEPLPMNENKQNHTFRTSNSTTTTTTALLFWFKVLFYAKISFFTNSFCRPINLPGRSWSIEFLTTI